MRTDETPVRRPRLRAAVSAIVVAALALAGQLATVPAFASEPTAPRAEATGPDRVELAWPDRAPAIEGSEGYRVRVLPEAGDAPIAEHQVGDEEDASVEPLTDGLLDGESGARVLGLEPDTAYRFAVDVIGADDAVLSEGDASEVVRTPAAEPAAEVEGAPAEEAPTARAERLTADAPAPLAAEASTAPAATVKGATAVLVDFSGFAATAPAGSFAVTAYAGDGDTVVSMGYPAAGATNAIVMRLAAGTAYSFDVQDFNTGTVSDRSPVVTTFAERVVPGVIIAPPTAQALSATSVLVSWPALESEDVYRYTIKAYLAGTDTVATTTTNIDPFTTGTTVEVKTGLLTFTAYEFTVTVQGYDAVGAESARSGSVTTLRGPALAPQSPTLGASGTSGTGLVARWSPPASDGGYPITAYEVRFYNPGTSVSAANLVRDVIVPATSTEYVFDDAMIVGSEIGFIVSGINAGGQGAWTSVARAGDAAARVTIPATAPQPTGPVRGELTLAAGETPGTLVLGWKTPADATASTGYYARIIEHIPSSTTSTANYTYRLVDLGRDFPISAGTAASTALTGLDGGKAYRVAVTAYELQPDGSRLYRNSATGPTEIALPGSSRPAKPGFAPPAPIVTGVDSVSWEGSALTDGYTGGSAITGYAVYLYENGSTTAAQRVVSTGAGDPSVAFTGLERDTLYQVRYAGINANGEGELSDVSPGARTLARPVPGSVPPPYPDLASLRAAIARGDVLTRTAEDAGIDGALEPNAAVHAELAWTGSAEPGEVWLYSETGAPAFQDEYAVESGEAVLDSALGDLATGEYRLLFLPETGTPVAVTVAVVRPVIGRTDLDDAVFRWGLNNEASNGAFFGGCNYLAAGKVADIGHSAVLTPDRYSAKEGNVEIVKPDATGAYQRATWATKCLTRYGSPVTTSVTSAYTESQVVIGAGTGWVDPSTDSADIRWTGDFTIVFYGGLTFWYASDPHLVVDHGVGTVTATASGFGADMFDESKWVELDPQPITLANLSGVRMTSSGFTATPAYLGVAVATDGGAHGAQAARTADNAAYWGSFPQDFIEFQELTGQLSYWYTSGGQEDRAKPALPLTVVYDRLSDTGSAGDGDGEGVSVAPPDAQAPPAQSPGRGRLIATATATPVDGVDTLLELIEEGAVTRIAGTDAGLAESFAVGERLDLRFPWTGEDASGVVWLYPGQVFVGSFRVVDGEVRISIDSSAVTGQGAVYLTFFGDAGTVVAVETVADGVVEAADDTGGAAEAGTTSIEPISAPVEPAPGSPAGLLAIVIGGGALAVAALVALTIVLIRRRSVVG